MILHQQGPLKIFAALFSFLMVGSSFTAHAEIPQTLSPNGVQEIQSLHQATTVKQLVLEYNQAMRHVRYEAMRRIQKSQFPASLCGIVLGVGAAAGLHAARLTDGSLAAYALVGTLGFAAGTGTGFLRSTRRHHLAQLAQGMGYLLEFGNHSDEVPPSSLDTTQLRVDPLYRHILNLVHTLDHFGGTIPLDIDPRQPIQVAPDRQVFVTHFHNIRERIKMKILQNSPTIANHQSGPWDDFTQNRNDRLIWDWLHDPASLRDLKSRLTLSLNSFIDLLSGPEDSDGFTMHAFFEENSANPSEALIRSLSAYLQRPASNPKP